MAYTITVNGKTREVDVDADMLARLGRERPQQLPMVKGAV